MTRFGEKILIPNSDLMKNRVRIIGGHTVPGRYITLFFYGTYAVPPAEVVEVVQQTLVKTRIEGSLPARSEEHTSELQSRGHLVCRLLLEKKKTTSNNQRHNQTELLRMT